jgi:hypothetical protein
MIVAGLTAGFLPDDEFENFLKSEIVPADGFDFPVGDVDGQGEYQDQKTKKNHQGWYVSARFAQWYSFGLHPGEDWNGGGGGNTDLGQPVYAVANGKVVFADDCGRSAANVVIIQHVYYENHQKKRIRSVYKLLKDIHVKKGQLVRRRQIVGTIGQDRGKSFLAHLHIELRYDETLAPNFWPTGSRQSIKWIREHYADPSAFIRSHRRLFVPQKEKNLVLINRKKLRMRYYHQNRVIGEYPIGLGRANLPKKHNAVMGSSPMGMYFIVDRKEKSGFVMNYPNKYDLARERKRGLILADEEAVLANAWQERRPTLGLYPKVGGIHLRGRSLQERNLLPCEIPWGNVIMYDRDIHKLLESIPVGTMVVFF